MRRARGGLLAALTAAALALTACTPGGDGTDGGEQGPVSTDIAGAGDVTLTVWDQEVRGGQDAQMRELNEAFMAQYPNVTINRVSQSFDDLETTLRLAITSDEAPDVVQVNNSRSTMGSFVAGGQIRSLDAYADAYGWRDRFEDTVLQYSSYSADGTTFGEGSLYGLPQMGEVVGLFYSRDKLQELGITPPKTIAELEGALRQAKDAGVTPLLLGTIEQWPAIHVFGPIQAAHVPADQIQQLGFGQAGATWKTDENLAAAEQLQSWAQEGLIDQGANGTDYDAAWQSLVKGEGAFLIGGSWLTADIGGGMEPYDAGFQALGSVTTGGTSVPFSITTASEHPDVAAAYIDFITNNAAMAVLEQHSMIPAHAGRDAEQIVDGFGAAVQSEYYRVLREGQLVPYLDYATPTFGDTLGAALQELMDGRITPDEFLQRLDDDYAAFVA